MKMKFIVFLSVFSFIYVACADKKTDGALTGTWEGQIQQGTTTQTLIYKFDGEKVETYLGQDQSLDNQIEVEMGFYEKTDKDRIKITIEKNSCGDLKSGTSLVRPMQYSISSDMTTLTLQAGIGKSMTLTRIDQKTANDIEDTVETAQTGCYVSDGTHAPVFKPKKIGKSTGLTVDLKAELNKI